MKKHLFIPVLLISILLQGYPCLANNLSGYSNDVSVLEPLQSAENSSTIENNENINASQSSEEAPETEEDSLSPDQEDPSPEMSHRVRVLFIGNSHTLRSRNDYSVGSILENIAAQNDKEVYSKCVVKGGASLADALKTDGANLAYHTKVMKALKNQTWDYIVLQDRARAGLISYETEMLPATIQFCQLINQYQSQAKILLYQTHGFNSIATLCVNGKSYKPKEKEYSRRIAGAYAMLGSSLGLEVVPVGTYILRYNTLHPDDSLISEDRRHLVYGGYYLAAECFYQAIFHEIPTVDANYLDYSDVFQSFVNEVNRYPLDIINLSSTKINLRPGKNYHLHTQVKSSRRDSRFTYMSLNPAIATVDKNGIITAKSKGTTAIVVSSTSNLQKVCVVAVSDTPQENLDFAKKNYVLDKDQSLIIYPKELDYHTLDFLEWKSSDALIASVDKNGLLTTHKAGHCKISLSLSNDTTKQAFFNLYVRNDAVKNVTYQIKLQKKASISLSWDSCEGATKYIIYRARGTKGTFQKLGTSWTSSYTDSKVKLGQSYRYKIVATSGYTLTQGAPSSSFTVKLLEPVKKLKASYSRKATKLSWAPQSSASGYEIFCQKNGRGPYIKIATLKGSQKHSFKCNNANKRNRYKVRSYIAINHQIDYGQFSKAVLPK